MRAINGFVFGGSATLGVEEAGFDVESVLEMTDNMHELNAYHFVRNRPDIPIIPPSTWEKDDYLSELRSGGDVDYSFFNPPCSGLSLASPNAKAENEINQQFFRVSAALAKIRPKTFTIENAPTLISFGTPILQQFMRDLLKDYKFTVIRDLGGHHGIAMKRARTMVVGWRRDYFEDKIPQVYMRKNEAGEFVLRDALEGIGHNAPNIDWQPDGETGLEFLIPGAVANDRTIDMEAAINIEKYEAQLRAVSDRKYEQIKRLSERMLVKGVWDKSYKPTHWDVKAGSLTGYTRLIHPDGERFFSVREYAALMGYPLDFIFHEGGGAWILSCIAQGVPVKFVKWIAEECKRSIEAPNYLSDADVVFQNNIVEKYQEFSNDEFQGLTKVELDKTAKVLRDFNQKIDSSMDALF